jgi:hypothetical protein
LPSNHRPQQTAEAPATEAKRALQEIWMAETKKDALAAFDAFVEPAASNTTRRSSV